MKPSTASDIAHRFCQINDNLIDAFIHLGHQYEKLGKRAADEAMHKAMAGAAAHLQAAGQVLNQFADTSIPEDAPFSTVKVQAFHLLEPEQFPIVANYLRNIAFDKSRFEWAYYTTLSHQFKRNLRHLFCELDFAGRVEDAPLLDAVLVLQDLLRSGKSRRQAKPSLFPVDVIPKSLQRYLFADAGEDDGDQMADGDKVLDVDRYEFLLYRLLRNALEAGNLYVKDSVESRRFEDDLISDSKAPLFVGSARSAAPNLHPGPGSPPIGASTATYAERTDFDGRPRNAQAGYDIGALQH